MLAATAFAQEPDHVHWTLTLEPSSAAPGAKVLARMTGKIDPGWHVYSMTTAAAIPTKVTVGANPAVEKFRVFQAKPKKALDPNFNLDTETYEDEAAFAVELQLKKDAPAGPSDISVDARYQTCSSRVCIPPVTRSASASLTVDAAAPVVTAAIPAGFKEVKGAPKSSAAVPGAGGDTQSLGLFLLAAFGVGLAAIFTPCVFPMIPITMSFFLGRQGTRQQGIFQAVVFCLGIVVLFSTLGLVTTAILGPFGVVQLGSNRWVNGFIVVVFAIFGLSLLGAFEITIPSAILTKLDKGAQSGGIGGTLLMGLTFSLASFACVGPFMGTLLAASVGGGGLRPLLGMATFASGLALPFFMLALFPSYLKKLPKSGGWLARVKVVMGFIVLAAMLKYLASVDQVLQWGFLTRERFLAAWIVLFAMAGLYLLGFIPLEGIKRDDHMGLGRLLTGMLFMIFAISLAPGMSGARLGDLEAYIPPAAPGSAGSAGGEGAVVWMKNQYREALEIARREGKLVLVNFTGYACTNCHWMKANMFTRPEIAGALKGFVLVDVYTDGPDETSKQNQDLELKKFKTTAIPYYAIMDPDENVIASFPGLTKDPQEYLAFLQTKPAGGAPTVVQAASAPNGLAGLGVTTVDGGKFDDSALAGKVVVIDFWATYCVPCIKEIPTFNKIYDTYTSKGVYVLGVSMDEENAPELVKSFLKVHPMKYQVGIGSEKLGERFKIEQMPTTVVFDRSGKELKRFEGLTPDDQLEAAVKGAL